MLDAQGYIDYVIINPEKRIIGSPYRQMIKRRAPAAYDLFLQTALAGELAVSRPFARELEPSQRSEGPTMFVAAPVKGTNGEVIAVLGLRMKPEQEFTRIFSVARMGESGETYAFDRRGMMLTASRFNDELKALGLIPNDSEATAILNLRLLDPGIELQPGVRPDRARHLLPLTRMAGAAVQGQSGQDLSGYRNYRGLEVIGAWAWLPEYEMGVATEVTVEEAYRTLRVLRQAFIVLFVLLLVSGAAVLAFTLLLDRVQASLRKNALVARKLGQYALIQEIGRGANGIVYRARHALLRRPVAIKLLSPDATNETTAARFEHEVQMTSQLTHPNTIAIYDYGRTPDGLFYYAMEFLSGIELDRLVQDFGPQPEGRVIHILRQVCGSLAEAHRIGLIHRDIKPANIALTRRGGVCDFVKVLDFGLVKALHRDTSESSTRNAVVGTPHFMSPEAVRAPESVDVRSDLYGVGAVGYWLVTSRTLFDSAPAEALMDQQVNAKPASPSLRLGRRISPRLEEVLLQCLEKDPARRPQSAEELETALASCAAAAEWTPDHALRWWDQHLAGIDQRPTITMAEKTLVISPRN
jgi:tRNA A-37 threonylcarbamoyl transferase component Bud32